MTNIFVFSFLTFGYVHTLGIRRSMAFSSAGQNSAIANTGSSAMRVSGARPPIPAVVQPPNPAVVQPSNTIVSNPPGVFYLNGPSGTIRVANVVGPNGQMMQVGTLVGASGVVTGLSGNGQNGLVSAGNIGGPSGNVAAMNSVNPLGNTAISNINSASGGLSASVQTPWQ
jgi:hypothetical protein